MNKVTCKHCKHSFCGIPSDACPCCYQVAGRPDWATADANDLRVYYTTVNGKLAVTASGQANGYA